MHKVITLLLVIMAIYFSYNLCVSISEEKARRQLLITNLNKNADALQLAKDSVINLKEFDQLHNTTLSDYKSNKYDPYLVKFKPHELIAAATKPECINQNSCPAQELTMYTDQIESDVNNYTWLTHEIVSDFIRLIFTIIAIIFSVEYKRFRGK